MEINGRLIKILPDVEGEGQRGHWIKGGFVVPAHSHGNA